MKVMKANPAATGWRTRITRREVSTALTTPSETFINDLISGGTVYPN